MQIDGLTRTAAERRIAGMDRLRTDYAYRFYPIIDWRDPSHYHLLVDSGV